LTGIAGRALISDRAINNRQMAGRSSSFPRGAAQTADLKGRRGMKVTGFNHLSIGTKNLAESVKFCETVLGMQTIPSYNFGSKTKYQRCGDLQLHIFELEDHVPVYQHFALDVDKAGELARTAT
jgi:hypothetical protein